MKELIEIVLFVLLLGHTEAGEIVPKNTIQPTPTPKVEILGSSTKPSNTLFNLVNSTRSANGLKNYSYSSALTRSAQARACDLNRTQEWTHTGYESYIYKSGYKITANVTWMGENLARNAGYDYPISDQEALERWLNSPTHRDNLLSANKYISIGTAKCGNYTVVHFGGRS
jgi:uncharacterized protein YkwD